MIGRAIRPIEHPIELARHDKIVLVQSLDLLGAQGADRVTPAEADVRVMAFGLGKLTEFLNKGERFPEIAESKGPLDAMSIVTQLPIGSLYLEVLGFITREWRDAAATRGACLLGERLSCSCPQANYQGNRGRTLIDRSPRTRSRASR